MNEVTNLKTTVSYLGKKQFTERYILPQFRDANDKLFNEAQGKDVEPIIIVGADDELWWNDDIVFMFDRMACCDATLGGYWPDGLEEFSDELIKNPPTAGEKRCFEFGKLKIEVVGDTKPMTNCKLKKF